jgi:hypothetical protein
MVRIETRRVARSASITALGAFSALVMFTAAPTAVADPAIPPPPPPAPALPLLPPAPDQDQDQSDSVQSLAGDQAPPDGMPHLPSPENLPPGTTDDPSALPPSHGLSYLRDLWHAVQTQDVSGGDALLLLTQRPMDPNALPPAGMPAGPQAPPPAAAPIDQTAAPLDPATPPLDPVPAPILPPPPAG